jgi:ABC-type phosphate/phosphonate transport system substrate-binding protein
LKPLLRKTKILLLFCLIANCANSGQVFNIKDKKTIQIKMGYSSVMLQDTKPADAKAAIYVWVEVLKKNILVDFNQKSELVPYIYYSLKEMENALSKKEIDILGLNTMEYCALKDKYNLSPAIAGTIEESPFTRYILITRADSDIKNLADLNHKILAQPKDQFNPLIDVWLCTLLSKYKISGNNKFFSRIRIEDKESNAAYSVYFKKADCAVIQKNVFAAICMLNPQFEKSFRILETSPELILGLTAIRKDADPDVVEMFYKVSSNVHKTIEGQNIIKLFRSKKLVEVTDKDLLSTKRLIDSYNMIKNKRIL